jgi:ribosome-binding protein aMBF1 (putative translation factor)
MKLDIDRIEKELKRRKWSKVRYAKEIGESRQLLNYYLHSELKNLMVLEKLARPLGIKPKSLIK